MTAGERFAIRLMVAQALLFSVELSIVHYLGPALSIVQFSAIRGLGGVLTAMAFARRFNIFRTEQLRLHLLRGITVLSYQWVLVYSFSQLPLSDATAISFGAQTIYVALFSILILGEAITPQRWISIVIGTAGAMLIAKPSFSEIGVVYLIALLGTSLNALSFVLNRYSNRKDSPETTMAFTNLAGFLGSLPLWFLIGPPDSTMIPCLLPFLILGPLGMYAGIVAVKHAEASALAPYTLLRLVFGVIGGTVIFFELPDMKTSIGIGLTALSCALTFDVAWGRVCSSFRRSEKLI